MASAVPLVVVGIIQLRSQWDGSDADLAFRLTTSAALLVWLGFVITMSLGGVWVRGDRVVIVNPLRVRRLRRRDIETFDLHDFWFHEVGRARLRDGTTIRLWGLADPGSWLVAELNRYLKEAS
jgi:hypothetical protein